MGQECSSVALGICLVYVQLWVSTSSNTHTLHSKTLYNNYNFVSQFNLKSNLEFKDINIFSVFLNSELKIRQGQLEMILLA